MVTGNDVALLILSVIAVFLLTNSSAVNDVVELSIVLSEELLASSVDDVVSLVNLSSVVLLSGEVSVLAVLTKTF